MTHQEALSFLEPSNILPGKIWADLGAGKGVFSYALAERLGPNGKVYAVDQSAEVMRLAPKAGSAPIIPQQRDIGQALDLPQLDGILLANVLHYFPDPHALLKELQQYLRLSGTLLVIEYDREAANPWVPYPISLSQWQKLAANLPGTKNEILAKRPSQFGAGGMYLAQLSFSD